MSDETADMAERVRDVVASDENNVSDGAEDYGVICIVMEEHAEDVDVGGVYHTDFRGDADDATAGAMATALAQSVPELLLELALAESKGLR